LKAVLGLSQKDAKRSILAQDLNQTDLGFDKNNPGLAKNDLGYEGNYLGSALKDLGLIQKDPGLKRKFPGPMSNLRNKQDTRLMAGQVNQDSLYTGGLP